MPDFLLIALSMVAIASALGVILSREAVHSALFLTVNLLTVGVFFLALQHQFLAVAQMLVYAGAVMVVFMFAVTTLSPDEEPFSFKAQKGLPLLAGFAALMAFVGLIYSFLSSALSVPTDAKSKSLVEASSFAYDLFGPYLLPFEGTAFLLLTALIGAIILGGRRKIGDG